MKANNDVNYAGFWARGLAFLLDAIFLLSIYYILFKVLLNISGLGADIMLAILASLYFFIFTLVLKQTIGKIIMGIKVVSATSSKLSWEDVLLREIIGKFSSSILLFSGLLLIAIDPKKQSLHDKMSGMLVVWEQDDLIKGD